VERLHSCSVGYWQLFSKLYNCPVSYHVPETLNEGDDITEQEYYRIIDFLAHASQRTFCLGKDNAKSQ